MQSKTPRASGRPAPTLRQVKPNFSSVSCRFQSQRSSDSAKCVGYTEIIATVLEAEVRGRKIEVGKFRRRKGTIRHNGHTQRYTKIQITGIQVPGFDAVSAPVGTASVPAEQS